MFWRGTFEMRFATYKNKNQIMIALDGNYFYAYIIVNICNKRYLAKFTIRKSAAGAAEFRTLMLVDIKDGS